MRQAQRGFPEGFGRDARGLVEIAVERADPVGRALVFSRAFRLGLIDRDHFVDRFATADRHIEHGRLPRDLAFSHRREDHYMPIEASGKVARISPLSR